MKVSKPFPRFAISILLFVFMFMGCDSSSSDDGIDIHDSASLSGTYDWVSLTDKLGELYDLPGQVLIAGEDNVISIEDEDTTIQVTINLNGTLTLTTSRYTMNTSITFTLPLFGTQTETETDTGSFSISGNTMTLVSDDSDLGGPDALTITASGNRLTLEDAEIKLILEKR